MTSDSPHVWAQRLAIESVSPVVQGGRYPAKAVVGEQVAVGAVCYRDGHAALGCAVRWRGPDGKDRPATRMNSAGTGTDQWQAVIEPDAVGLWTFHIQAWSDPYLTWHDAVTKKLAAGQGATELANDFAEGAGILEAAALTVGDDDAITVRAAAEALRGKQTDLGTRVTAALDAAGLLWHHPVREQLVTSPTYQIWVDRQRALFSAWYEFFPRSEAGPAPAARPATKPSAAPVPPARPPAPPQPKHGTFTTAADRLPAIAAMGFDIVYLPPIHPIGTVNRKGRNNAVVARPGDVGSPWAIGSTEGGHDAIHPQLGTDKDFRAFVARAGELGLEVALDLALQCAPDHPWVAEHPEWFTAKPDGTIAYAENPPKKYQDIYPLNFDNDPEGIRAEVRRVVLHWVERGVKIFRVDNPHTKPQDFWAWLIWQVKAIDPDVLFLAEAFTRPPMMHGLAGIGFTQSYTYFTWRNSPHELRQYCEELVACAHYMRPNFWPNTPDILHESLQHGGPTLFKIRAILASMLSPSWGMYSGYELYEHLGMAGSEEYRDSEKYQLRPRDWAGAEAAGRSLAPFIGKLNAIRRRNPALHWLANLRFHDIDNGEVICFSKRDTQSDNTILVVCSFDPIRGHWANTTLDMPALGFDWHERFTVRDELTGAEFDWGQHNSVRLDPRSEPAHIFTVHRRD